MTEETTPEETLATDTSAAENAASDTAAITTAPETTTAEPGNIETEADKSGEEEAPQQLYAGKYKSVDELEKAYKESEKFVSKAKEYEKQLKAYREAEEASKAEREAEAKRAGFSDESSRQLVYEVKNREFMQYVRALDALEPEARTKAQAALSRYQYTVSPKDLEAAQSFFPPMVIAAIAKDTALFEEERAKVYENERKTRSLAESKARLEAFARETGDWMNPKERQEILALAINLTGGEADLSEVKRLIDMAEKAAVDRYVAESKAAAENREMQGSLSAPAGGTPPAKGEKWLSREDFNALSDAEFDKQYDKIARQIELEKAGKLTRMLTR